MGAMDSELAPAWPLDCGAQGASAERASVVADSWEDSYFKIHSLAAFLRANNNFQGNGSHHRGVEGARTSNLAYRADSACC
eukprot:1152055-Pelagomonas_calceolata.AAC.1